MLFNPFYWYIFGPDLFKDGLYAVSFQAVARLKVVEKHPHVNWQRGVGRTRSISMLDSTLSHSHP